MGDNDWKMNGKVFSVGELSEIVELLDFWDVLSFSFSGKDYRSLKEHIETHAGCEMRRKYRVSRNIDVSNTGIKLNQEYNVCIKRIPS